MFGMACFLNLPERIGDLETLILITSCICHDLGGLLLSKIHLQNNLTNISYIIDHPGYNNIYQVSIFIPLL